MSVIASATKPFSWLRLKDHSFSNPRTSSGISSAEIRELASHILRHGLLTPLLVTPDGLVLAGQRRYRALELIYKDLEAIALDCFATIIITSADEEPVAAALLNNISVRILHDANLDGIALADNLLRVDLSSYEVAKRLVVMSDGGVTGKELSKLIGRDPAYVSKKLTTYRRACPELLAAWELGTMTDDVIMRIADMEHDKQRAALNGTVPVRGPNARPKIEAVKDALLIAETNVRRISNNPYGPGRSTYEAGVLDALRWVTGQRASEHLAKLVDDETSE